MDWLLKWLDDPQHQAIVYTIAAAIVMYIVNVAIQKAFLRKDMDLSVRHKIRRGIRWFSLVIFFVIAFLIWGKPLENSSVFFGIVGAGLALSMQETLLCIAGWVLIIFRKPFDIGDRIEVNGQIGDVIDIALFQTSMLEVGNWVHADQSTGRMLIVPNSAFFRHSVFSYTKGFPYIWNEISIIVTFESDWEAAKSIMLKQAEAAAEELRNQVSEKIVSMQSQYAIRFEHLTPMVYTDIADNGVCLTLRHLTPVRQRRAAVHRVSEGILKALLAEPAIDFAYPTWRVFDNPKEGKPQAGGPAPK